MTIKEVWLSFKGCEIGVTSYDYIYVKRPDMPMQVYCDNRAGGKARIAFCEAVYNVFNKYITKKIEQMGFDPVTGVKHD